MGLLSGIFGDNFGKELVESVQKYFPPDLSPEQKANLELAAQNFSLQKQAQLDKAALDAEKLLNERIAMYEGTASDLSSVPILGPLMLLLRGSQRIIWGFGTLWLDFQVYSGTYNLATPLIQNTFWIMNVLVLGFLFGERALTNVMPYITELVKVRQGDK